MQPPPPQSIFREPATAVSGMRVRDLLQFQDLRTAETRDDQRFHAASVAVDRPRKFVASSLPPASIIVLSFRPQQPREYPGSRGEGFASKIGAARGCRWKRPRLPCLERKRSPGSFLPVLLF